MFFGLPRKGWALTFPRYTMDEYESLPAKVIWYTAGRAADDSPVPQVAYEITGCPRSILEAAASRAFLHVSDAVLESCLHDMRIKSRRARHENIRLLIEGQKDKWQWTDYDIARVMIQVLPGFKRPSRKPEPSKDFLNMEEETIWDDIQSVAHALQATSSSAAPAAPAAPAASAVPGESLLEAVAAVRDARAGRPKAKGPACNSFCRGSLVHSLIFVDSL